MSGVAGGQRIEKKDVKRTFDKYVKDVLEKIPGFKKASLSGSVKAGSKPDFGDLDLIVQFEGEDKKEVKQRIIKTVTSEPDSVIVPFKSEKYSGKKYYNSGEIITILFPITGQQDKYIQVDNIISLSDEEHAFKNSFLDLPAEKQGLLLGLVKVILLEENPVELLKRLSINDVPQLTPDEELEFNLSSNKLTLRKVKLKDFKTVAREDLWSTTNWGLIRELFKNYNIDGTFEDLLQDIKSKVKNPRSKERIKGVFNSMVSVKSGEVGTPKGAGKEKALQTVNTILEDEQGKTVGLYAGGFKPPHKAHFNNAKFLADKVDRLVIFIGPKVREGVRISAEQSKSIWEIYAKYLPIPVDIILSEVTPIRDIYTFVDDNQNSYSKIITGTLPEEAKRFDYFIKNKEKYPTVEILELPREGEEDSKFSANSIRNSVRYLKSGEWTPQEINNSDKERSINIASMRAPSEKEIQMQEALDKTLHELFNTNQLVKEGSSGTAIAPKSVIASKDRAMLVTVYKKLLTLLGDEYYDIVFNGDSITVRNKKEGERVGFDYTPYMGSILEYMIDQKMKVTPLPEVKIRRDIAESSDFFGRTAFYDPNKKEVVLYVEGRHPKDVMRSFTHEMIHHKQNLEGRLGSVGTTNTNEDSNLIEIEKEAYLEGNITFRNWEDEIKNGKKKEVMAEGKYDKLTNTISSNIFKAWKQAVDEGEDGFQYKDNYEGLGANFDVEATIELTFDTGTMDVIETTGAGTDNEGDFIRIDVEVDEQLLPEIWEEISMTLKDIVRHEIEHLTHNIGSDTANPNKGMADDLERRAWIKSKKSRANQYLELEKEVDANLQGLLLRAKKEKKPFADVVNRYIDSQDITPSQKEKILTLWRKRLPALGIRQLL